MKGFFTKKETESNIRTDGKTLSCISCGLYKDCKSPRMKPYGNFKKKIMIIGEAPGKEEDNANMPFQGRTGRLLKRTMKELGIDIFEDCVSINAVRCRVPDDKIPTNYEIECCRRFALRDINEYKPKVIIILGNSALFSLIGDRWKQSLGGINKWRGFTIPDQDFKAWVCPTFHSSFIERDEDSPVEVIWKQDLKQAVEMVDIPFREYKVPEIEYIEDLRVLYDIKTDCAFDFETSAKKPHAKGQRIVSASIADSVDHCFAFMMPETRIERIPFTDFLANEKIGKIAQNLKFEEAWSVVKLRTPVKNWIWDTMLASHILENRSGVTGLKFQTYIQLGVVDYSSETDGYLKPKGGNGNSMNTIFDLVKTEQGIRTLLKYNAYDSINTYRLYKIQRDIIN